MNLRRHQINFGCRRKRVVLLQVLHDANVTLPGACTMHARKGLAEVTFGIQLIKMRK